MAALDLFLQLLGQRLVRWGLALHDAGERLRLPEQPLAETESGAADEPKDARAIWDEYVAAIPAGAWSGHDGARPPRAEGARARTPSEAQAPAAWLHALSRGADSGAHRLVAGHKPLHDDAAVASPRRAPRGQSCLPEPRGREAEGAAGWRGMARADATTRVGAGGQDQQMPMPQTRPAGSVASGFLWRTWDDVRSRLPGRLWPERDLARKPHAPGWLAGWLRPRSVGPASTAPVRLQRALASEHPSATFTQWTDRRNAQERPRSPFPQSAAQILAVPPVPLDARAPFMSTEQARARSDRPLWAPAAKAGSVRVKGDRERPGGPPAWPEAPSPVWPPRPGPLGQDAHPMSAGAANDGPVPGPSPWPDLPPWPPASATIRFRSEDGGTAAASRLRRLKAEQAGSRD